MLTLINDRSRVAGPDAESEAHWARRVAALCRDLCRAVSHVDDIGGLAAIAVELAARDLRAEAAGFWLLDRDNGNWRLIAAGGAIEAGDARDALSTLPALVRGTVAVEPAAFADHVDGRLLRTRGGGAVRCWSCAAAAACGSADTLGMLALWSSQLDQSPLCAAAETIARELACGLAALQRAASVHDLARVGSAVFDFAQLAIASVTPGWTCTRWNPAAEKLFGWPESDALGQPLGCIPSAHRASWVDVYDACVRDRVPVQARLPGQRWDGAPLSLSVRFVPLPRSGSDAEDVLLLMSDETEQEAIQRYLRVELEVAAILSQSASTDAVRRRLLSGICQGLRWEAAELWEADEGATHWVRTAGWQSGAAEAPQDQEPSRDARLPIDEGLPGLARRMQDIIWGADVPRGEPLGAQSAPLEACDHDFVAVPILLGGDVRAVLVFYGVDAGSVGARLHDLIAFIADQVAQALAREQMSAALRETEEALRQTRKMEAIGMLAGGIAHDFNNLLTVILGNCELLQDQLAAQPRIGEFVEEIRSASDRAAQLTRQLLTFSRKRPSQPDVVNLNQVLRDFERMLQRVVGAATTVEMRLDPAVHPVRLDRVEFEQVMLNLAANARDAMPGGGRLTISTANVSLGLKAVASFSDVKPGDFAELCVSDTGCGMDEQTRSRVFQPFFTTKGVGQGTGLGLATVYGIIRNGHGFVRVESQPGAGTRFLIYLPRTPLGIAPREVDAQPADDPRGSETVLVVEDEDVLRNLVQRILAVHGYTVYAAPNGRDALDLLRDGAQGAHLLLTDIVMPQMTGLQLAEEARRLRPELPTLFMSGYPDLADPTGSHIPRGADLLCKPFTSDALARAVRQALDRSRVRAPSAAGPVPAHCGPAAS